MGKFRSLPEMKPDQLVPLAGTTSAFYSEVPLKDANTSSAATLEKPEILLGPSLRSLHMPQCSKRSRSSGPRASNECSALVFAQTCKLSEHRPPPCAEQSKPTQSTWPLVRSLETWTVDKLKKLYLLALSYGHQKVLLYKHLQDSRTIGPSPSIVSTLSVICQQRSASPSSMKIAKGTLCSS